VLAAELEDRGFVVAQAEHAVAALAILDGGLRPDVLLRDLAMPGELDGVGLIERTRQRLPRLPTVLMTGHAADPVADRLEQGGAFALARKPVTVDALVNLLSHVIGNENIMQRLHERG
jgi:DNA-binding NtrC family response regulator